MADVIKANVYLTDITDFAAMNKVYETFFEAPYPVRTTVGIAALPGGARVEIEVVAALAPLGAFVAFSEPFSPRRC